MRNYPIPIPDEITLEQLYAMIEGLRRQYQSEKDKAVKASHERMDEMTVRLSELERIVADVAATTSIILERIK